MSDKKRILVVDDDPDFASAIATTLEGEGFLVEQAYNGTECLEKVKESPPDLILLDIMMPEVDGYEVCAELKGDKQYAKIPIIALTSVASQVPKTKYSHYDGMSMEADDYLPKIVSTEEIIKSINKLLS